VQLQHALLRIGRRATSLQALGCSRSRIRRRPAGPGRSSRRGWPQAEGLSRNCTARPAPRPCASHRAGAEGKPPALHALIGTRIRPVGLRSKRPPQRLRGRPTHPGAIRGSTASPPSAAWAWHPADWQGPSSGWPSRGVQNPGGRSSTPPEVSAAQRKACCCRGAARGRNRLHGAERQSTAKSAQSRGCRPATADQPAGHCCRTGRAQT